MKSMKPGKATKIISLVLAALLMLGMFSAAGAEEVMICQSRLTLIVGDTFDLSAGSASEGISWTVDRSDVATVDETGVVTAVAIGEAVVTASQHCGEYTCHVEVVPKDDISLSQTAVVIASGASLQLNLDGAGGKTTWKVSDKNIASVNMYGRITAKAPGKVTVTARNHEKNYTCVLFVRPSVKKITGSVVTETASAKQKSTGTRNNQITDRPENEPPVAEKPAEPVSPATEVKTAAAEKPEEQKPVPEKTSEEKPAEAKTASTSQTAAITDGMTSQEAQKQNAVPEKTRAETQPAKAESEPAKPVETKEGSAEAKQDAGAEKPADSIGKTEDTAPAETYTVSYVTETADIPYQTEDQTTPYLYKGTRTIAQDGKVGKKEIKYEIKTDSKGNQVSRTVVSETVVKAAVNEIYFVGTFEPEVSLEVVKADPTGMTGERNSDIDQRCEDQALWMAENVVQHSYTGGGDPGYTESVGGWGSLEEAIAGTEAHGGSAVNHREQYGFGVVKKTETLPDGNTKETYYAVSQGQSGDYNPFEDPHYAWVQEGLDGPIREVVEVYHGDP